MPAYLPFTEATVILRHFPTAFALARRAKLGVGEWALVMGAAGAVPAVVELLKTSEMQAAAERFVETVAFGAGASETLPDSVRNTFIRNAPTFLDESNDPEGLGIDLNSLRAFDKPALVTRGTESPPFFKPITEAVAEALPLSTFHSFEGGGHVPHLSEPGTYVQTVGQFWRQTSPL